MNAKGHTIISRFREAVNLKADILLRSKKIIYPCNVAKLIVPFACIASVKICLEFGTLQKQTPIWSGYL